jgi:hypothetical protein
MKFLRFMVADINKAADVAQASDKVWSSSPPGIKMLASYVCQGLAFPGHPAHELVAIAVIEAESNEAIAPTQWPVSLAGATMIWDVPVLEMPVTGAAEVERKVRG